MSQGGRSENFDFGEKGSCIKVGGGGGGGSGVILLGESLSFEENQQMLHSRSI